MTIKILLIGASGRMGQATVAALQDEKDLQLVACPNKEDDLSQAIVKSAADVVIDFSNAAVVFENAKKIIAAGARPVIGATGLQAQQIEWLENACATKKLGGIIAPNFSLGAILLMRYAQETAKYFPEVEIIEMHHAGKLDSPSGTALRTAEMIAQNRQAPASKPLHETIPGARGANHHNIPIHAVRLPGLVAHLNVMFGGVGETLSLQHDTINRECFMPGVKLACRKVMALKTLVYGLDKILE